MRLSIQRPSWPVGLIIALFIATGAFAVGLAEAESTPVGYSSADVALLVTYVLLALVFSFLCSVAEAVLLSITPSYIAGLQSENPRRAALITRLKQEKVDQSLAAILTLNTIAHTVGAIGSGAKATVVFGSAWFGLFSAVVTLLILFLSEIVPKTLGALYWRGLAGVTAMFVRSLIVILFPLIWVSESVTRLVARGKPVHLFSREEFIAMASLGEQTGQIEEHESRIIRNLFRFGSLKARDIMTPRTVIVGLPKELTVSEALNRELPHTFSRLPLYEGNLDHVTGFILKDDLLLYKAQDQGETKLEALRRSIASVSGEMTLSALLEFLLNERQHIALVLDEFGGTKGLVALEDVVETLLGSEIVDELDAVDDMQVFARQQWARRAKARGLEVPKAPADRGGGSL